MIGKQKSATPLIMSEFIGDLVFQRTACYVYTGAIYPSVYCWGQHNGRCTLIRKQGPEEQGERKKERYAECKRYLCVFTSIAIAERMVSGPPGRGPDSPLSNRNHWRCDTTGSSPLFPHRLALARLLSAPPTSRPLAPSASSTLSLPTRQHRFSTNGCERRGDSRGNLWKPGSSRYGYLRRVLGGGPRFLCVGAAASRPRCGVRQRVLMEEGRQIGAP